MYWAPGATPVLNTNGRWLLAAVPVLVTVMVSVPLSASVMDAPAGKPVMPAEVPAPIVKVFETVRPVLPTTVLPKMEFNDAVMVRLAGAVAVTGT